MGAADEYWVDSTGQGCEDDDCNDGRYGFLNVLNGNCERCNVNGVACIMKADGSQEACHFTYGQLGWHDYDYDRWNEAPDRNSRRSANIWDVHPGDILEIHNILDETV